MIEFSIPDFWHQSEVNSILINLMKEQPELFDENIKIGSIYGSFPCIWNGGRYVYGTYDKQQTINIIEFFNKNQIEIRHTFTNRFLKLTDRYDHVCNQICEITSEIGKKYNIKNACNIYDDDLAEYISKKYPDLKIIYSTTKELQNLNQINEYSKNNLVIPSYKVNHNFQLLKQLKYPQNIELLCIEIGCIINCPYRIEHQDAVSASILQITNPKGESFNEEKCPISKTTENWYKRYLNPEVCITKQQIQEIYLPLNINKFKISGRGQLMTNTLANIESYVNYFIKQEYRDYFRIEILNKLFLWDKAVIGGISE